MWNAEGLGCWAAAGEAGIEADTQFKLGVGEWTLGTAWPATLCLLLSCTGRRDVSGLESAFGSCCRAVIFNLGYVLASCRALKNYS